MNKYIVIIVAFVFTVSLIIGFSTPLDLSSIIAFTFNFQYLFFNIILYLLAFGLSYIGIPFYYVILLFEIIASGIVSAFLIVNFSLAGLLISLLLIAFKLIIWFFLFLNGFYSLKLIKNNFKYFFKRHRINKENSKIYLKKMIVISLVLIMLSLISVPFNKKIIIPLTKYFLF